MFAKVLIANRGEIAVRIIRACKELGIPTVAVYSEADRHSIHVREADQAVLLGGPLPGESYLDIKRILAAARQTKADAIHPGYGFLSENPDFAEAVQAAGLTFIGPPPAAIRAMGDKAESKRRMQQTGLPTIPGAQDLRSFADFERAAASMGYPVLVKASAGGGGKGMQIVWNTDDLPEELEAARRVALSAFGDDRLLLEKYFQTARHVEFQVFGDQQGNLVHLFERECSVQRRHQKIIEETPSPLLTPELRERMGEAAVAAARAVGYTNAGTVEFLVDPETGSFYFLEMNTRLQVEHAVTECLVGLDLVQWQIRIAAGERFPFRQADLTRRGHALECRIYAEDPGNGFLPSTGKLIQWVEPRGPGIRLDSGVSAGSEVTHYYDPLLAKLIVHAEDRPASIRRMQAALKEFVIHGVATNIDFLQDLLAHPDFSAGKVSTSWVENTFNWRSAPAPEEAVVAAAIADSIMPSAGRTSVGPAETDPFSPWKSSEGFRN
ncbi:MAG TPA: acetyl-CoA carboxylase biotin carboxylase subunit [Anaerolineales bacterium]